MNQLLKVTVLALAVASFSVYSGAQDSQERLATKHAVEGTYNKDAIGAVAHPDSTPADAAPAGPGTKDYIPLWLSSTKAGSSTLFQNSSGDIGIGTTTPAASLDVDGSINAATGFDIGGSSFAFGSLGEGNAFLGFAGNTSTTGTDNTATGAGALQANSTGSGNVAYGQAALVSNTTGNDSAAFGTNALFSNTTGAYNTATGVDALEGNTTASYSTATGYQALQASTGTENTATGALALWVNSTAEQNTADGYAALFSNTTGEFNTASGVFALYNNTTGTANTAIGLEALLNNTTGSSNVAVGVNAGTGTNKDLNNTTAIGYYAQVDKSNALVLGSTAAQNGAANILVGIDVSSPTNILTVLQGGGDVIADGYATYSSRRWKTNIQTLHGALEKVERLRGVSYDLKANGQHEVGVIAEEVGAVVPELVTYEANGKDARGVDYSRLTALLIEATKEQQALIRHQQELIRAQEAEIRTAQTQNASQQEQIAQLASQVHSIQLSLSTGQQAGLEVRAASVRTASRQ